MRRPVAIVWIVGLLIALLLYLRQPEHVIDSIALALNDVEQRFDGFIISLSHQSILIVRALAIALFIVFVALAIIAGQRGLPARRMLLVVAFLYIVLLWHPFSGLILARDWVFAFLISAVASLVMTRRLGGLSLPGRGRSLR